MLVSFFDCMYRFLYPSPSLPPIIVSHILLVNFANILLLNMSTTIQAEASKPQNKKMQECRRCKEAGFPNQLIGFEKSGEDPITGKIRWKNQESSSLLQNEKPVVLKRRRLVDISA